MADSAPVGKSAAKRARPVLKEPPDTVEDVPERLVADAADRLFDDLLMQAPGASRVARLALEYSHLRADREWIVGRDSLLLAALWSGFVDPNAQQVSAWICSWLAKQKPALFDKLVRVAGERENAPDTVAQELFEGRQPRLSDAVLQSVGPRAIDYARATMGLERANSRHLLFALFDFPTAIWSRSEDTSDAAEMTEGDFRDLKNHLVDRIAENADKGENMEVWRAIAEGTFQVSPATAPPVPANDDDERTGFQTDEPALVDELYREGFADALVQLVVQVREKNRLEAQTSAPGPDPNHAFMMHLDGPWGTGKSSVLNFVRAKLRDKHWLVVDFNAWKLQRLEPAWWSVITQVQRASLEQAHSPLDRARLWLISQLSRLRFIGLPMIVGVVLLILAIWLGVLQFAGHQDEAWKALGAIITALGGLFAFSRTLLFGQSKAVQSFETLQSDPYRPIMAHFSLLVRSIRRPIIVLIDDLDRCSGDYVVALVENIQTMLRGEPIVYLVAADRQWIRTSFEKKYADFHAQAPDAGRPLGYLFLEKIFQVSSSLPTMSPPLKLRYWSGLVAGPRGAAARGDAAPVQTPPSEAAIAKAVTELLTHNSHAGLQAAIKAQPDEQIKRRLRRAAAEHLASPIVQQRTENRLAGHPELMDANPRAMKRLLSAVTMNGARMFTEEREVSLEQIARWSALELRWPLLAMRLAKYPGLLRASAGEPQPAFAGPADPELDALLAGDAVQVVLGAPGEPAVLDRDALRKLLF